MHHYVCTHRTSRRSQRGNENSLRATMTTTLCAIAQPSMDCPDIVYTERSMPQTHPVTRVHHYAGWEARDRYRWLLLTGWFVMISAVLPFVVAPPQGGQPASEILIAVAAVALVAYNMAVKRWAIAVGLLIGLVAVMGWIVTR